VTDEEYSVWVKAYDAATNAIENREEAIDQANALMEHSLIILGATALEDKLQEGVPEAIELLHRAGIKLWILTGIPHLRVTLTFADIFWQVTSFKPPSRLATVVTF
jgi:phosphoglycolate phosphatase-like HAD superfamily hydrolase